MSAIKTEEKRYVATQIHAERATFQGFSCVKDGGINMPKMNEFDQIFVKHCTTLRQLDFPHSHRKCNSSPMSS